MSQDFQTVPAPRRAEQRKPYEPLRPDLNRIPEFAAAAKAEARRAAGVERFLEAQRQKHAEMRKRGPIPQAIYPVLPTADEAQHAIERARQKLFVAVAARDAAREAAEAAQRAAEVGREAAARLSDEVAAADRIDGEIARWQAERIEAGEPHDDLPADLIARRAERDRLAQKGKDAAAAADVLGIHREAAQQQLVEAQGRVNEAVARVLDAVSEHIAGAMLAAQRRASELRGELNALGSVQVGARRYQLPASVLQGCRDCEALAQAGAGDAGR